MTTVPSAKTCPATGATLGGCPVAHGPKGLPVVGVAPTYFRDPLQFTLRTQEEYGSVVPVKLPKPFFQITEPDAVERILRSNPDNYTRGALYDGFLGVMGRGLLTLDTEQWRPHRKVVQPAFTPARVRHDASEAVAATQNVLRRWENVARMGRAVDVSQDLMDISSRVIGKALIGDDLSKPGLGYARAAAIASKVMYTSTIYGLNALVPGFVPTPYHRERKWAHNVLTGIIRSVFRRGRTGDVGEDAAGLLLASDLPDDAVADDLRTLFLAGSDTTGQALTWTLYELARHPQVRREVEDEVDRLLGGQPPSVEQLDELVVTRSAVDEALRLHPPVWQFPRDTIDADELGGYHIPAKSTVLMSAYGTHRSPEHWSDPETFDPLRFRDSSAQSRHRYAYFPFGGGRRLCIGKGLALSTIVTAVAMVSQRYRLRLLGTQEVVSGTYITLFPKDGLRVVIEERT